ncbi:MAG: MASE1 domain-containing protein [Phycisphaerae bacterium]|nr:MASE1 domain-containing protein [Tepidisphaeraceae bacterium]
MLLRTLFCVLAAAVAYYATTQIAWALCFPDSKVSLFFPPHAVLVSILLLVPARHWWAYTLAAVTAHFIATQRANWPPIYALHCEFFDAVKALVAAAAIRLLIKSPLKALTLRDSVVFVLVAVVLVPFAAAFWGAALTIYHGFGSHYWVEWRNLGISNAVTTVVLVPALLLGAHHLFVRRPKVPTVRRAVEAMLVAASMAAIGIVVFDRTPAGPNATPPLLYTPIPLLVWAALRFGLAGISMAMLLITFQAIWGTMRGHGPFLDQSPADNALALQMFLLMTATPLMLLAVVVEEERRTKEALRLRTDLMGLAAESANAAIWVWDLSTDEWWITEHGRALFSLEPGARVNLAALLERVHADDRPARVNAIARSIESRGDYEIEYRVQHPGGEIRWLHARGRCVTSGDGSGPTLLGVSTDVTARKQAEAAAVLEREDLAHLSRVALLGEMTASLAHELNQPLAAMAANAAAAQRFLARDEPDLAEVHAILADIAADGRRAAGIIRGIRNMACKADPKRVLVDVNAVVVDVVRLAHPDAYARHCELTTDRETDLPAVLADPVQLQQVLLNLVINALDAMRSCPAGQCRVEVASRRAGATAVEVSVRDRGPGLPAGPPGRVFERFFSTKPDGMGMGLAIARSIIEAHAGTLDAENADGGGARFWFRLPAHESAVAPVTAPAI